MTSRPHMKLRFWDTDVVIGYEQRGKSWVLYRRIDGAAPGAAEQHFFATVFECHEAWQKECKMAIDSSDGLFAPGADIGTRTHIAVLLDDA